MNKNKPGNNEHGGESTPSKSYYQLHCSLLAPLSFIFGRFPSRVINDAGRPAWNFFLHSHWLARRQVKTTNPFILDASCNMISLWTHPPRKGLDLFDADV
jgi:hypothetical protein